MNKPTKEGKRPLLQKLQKLKMTQMSFVEMDGKTYHVSGLKNQYYQNDYTTQGNLQIQCNP